MESTRRGGYFLRESIKQSEATAPAVAPVAAGQHRPLWSVMIPTFNCAKYLRLTLQSVLAQDLGPEAMQIEVVDDCSTKDDPETVVREVGHGRVQFHRKPQNGGAIANFNTCIERSRGHLVHILHGDDLVLPGFYERFTAVADAHPELALIACRSFFVDENGIILTVSGRVLALENGGTDVSDFYYGTAIQTAAAVVRRSFYERHGGFLPALVHTADCEMWSRAASMQGGIVLSDVLCQYRMFTANDTGRLMRSAENLRDIERLNALMATRYQDFDQHKALRRVAATAEQQMRRFRELGDVQAYEANRAFYERSIPLAWRIKKKLARDARRVFARWR